MLSYALATHPDTTPDVLAVLTDDTHALAAAHARLRLNRDDPWAGLNTADFGVDEQLELLNHPALTLAARQALLTAGTPSTWSYYVTTPHATDADLRTLTRQSRGRHSSPAEALAWASHMAIHPNTPTDIVHEHLAALAAFAAHPALFLAALDTHNIPACDIDIPSLPGSIEEWVVRYYETGGLLETLEGLRLPLTLTWCDVLPYTTNTEVVHRALNLAAASDNPNDLNQLRKAVARNTLLPDSIYTPIVSALPTPSPRVAMDNPDMRATFTGIHGAELDRAVTHTTPDKFMHLLVEPHLTNKHLRTLTQHLRPAGDTDELLYSVARIVHHPNARPDTQHAALTALAAAGPVNDWEESSCSATALDALNEAPLIVDALLPEDPIMGERTLLTPAVHAFLRTYPALLTSPEAARVCLTLAPDFDGTVDALAATAGLIAQ